MESIFTAPDGQQFLVTVPDGTAPEVVRRYTESQYAQFMARPPRESDEAYNNWLRRFGVGVAEGTGGPAVAELVSSDAKNWIDRYQREARAARLRSGEDVDIAGGIGQAIGFLGALPIGGLGLKAVAAAGKAGTLPARIGTAAEQVAAALQGNRLRDYMAQGALQGAMTPMEQEGDDPWTTKAEQVALGATAGGLMKPLVWGASGAKDWAKKQASQLWNAYARTEGDVGATNVAQQAFSQIMGPEERKGVVELLKKAETDPAYRGMTSEQILRAHGEEGATLAKMLENERLQSGPHYETYRKQQQELLGGSRNWLKGVKGEQDLLAREVAIKDAASEGYEAAKVAPVLVNAEPIAALIDRLATSQPLRSTKFAKDAVTGDPLTGPGGEAIRYPGATELSPLADDLQKIKHLLIETDSHKEFGQRLQRAAAKEVVASPNIRIQGHANKLNALIAEAAKGKDIGSRLKELQSSIKKSGYGEQEVGGAVEAVRSLVGQGRTRFTDTPATLIGVRSQIKKMQEGVAPNEAAILQEVVKAIDEATGLSAVNAVRSAAEQNLNKRKIADALLKEMGGEGGTAPTLERVLAATGDPRYVQSVVQGPKPVEETFAKYFPTEQAELERLSKVSRGIGGYMPLVKEKGTSDIAKSTIAEVPHALNRELTILANVGRVAAKRLQEPVSRTVLGAQMDKKKLMELLQDVPVSQRQKMVQAIAENLLVQQSARALVPRLVAGQQ